MEVYGAMDTTQEIFTRFDAIEMILVRVTVLIGLFFFCALYLWSHVRELKGRKRNRRNRRK